MVKPCILPSWSLITKHEPSVRLLSGIISGAQERVRLLDPVDRHGGHHLLGPLQLDFWHWENFLSKYVPQYPTLGLISYGILWKELLELFSEMSQPLSNDCEDWYGHIKVALK